MLLLRITRRLSKSIQRILMLIITEVFLMIESVIINQQLIILLQRLNQIQQRLISIIIEVLHLENNKFLMRLFKIIHQPFKLTLRILKHSSIGLSVMIKWATTSKPTKITKRRWVYNQITLTCFITQEVLWISSVQIFLSNLFNTTIKQLSWIILTRRL